MDPKKSQEPRIIRDVAFYIFDIILMSSLRYANRSSAYFTAVHVRAYPMPRKGFNFVLVDLIVH